MTDTNTLKSVAQIFALLEYAERFEMDPCEVVEHVINPDLEGHLEELNRVSKGGEA